MSANLRPAVFLDRDGTLIDDQHYAAVPEMVKLTRGVPEALSELNAMGFLHIVISNQSGVARGLTPIENVYAVNRRINELLAEAGAPLIDAFYFCPHLSEGVVPEYAVTCNCRKPKPGMVLMAEKEHGIDLAHSAIIGDNIEADIGLGNSLGLAAIYFNSRGVEDAPGGIIGAAADFRDIPAMLKRHFE